MAEIERIVIKGSSGYGCIDEAYKDKVSITSTSVVYEYVPYVETEINPKRKWSYRTNSPIFQKMYNDIVEVISEVTGRKNTEFCTDIGGVEFVITYSDKTNFKETYWVNGDYFEELFTKIKRLVPESEYTPAVLLTSEDYEEG